MSVSLKCECVCVFAFVVVLCLCAVCVCVCVCVCMCVCVWDVFLARPPSVGSATGHWPQTDDVILWHGRVICRPDQHFRTDQPMGSWGFDQGVVMSYHGAYTHIQTHTHTHTAQRHS